MNQDNATQNIPPEVLEVLNSETLSAALYDIGEKYKLHIDHIGELGVETRLVLLGNTSPDLFISKIRERLDVSQNVAEQIATDINEKIFIPIREKMKDIYKTPQQEEGLDRDQILHEIENPTKAVHPITQEITSSVSTINTTVEKPKMEAMPENIINEINAPIKLTEIAPAQTSKPTMNSAPTPSVPSPQTSIVQNKLNALVTAAKEDMLVKPNIPAEKKTYTVDPYREVPK